jgi:hypothetical protein
MADADDFDIEYFRTLMKGGTPQAAPAPPVAPARAATKQKPSSAKAPTKPKAAKATGAAKAATTAGTAKAAAKKRPKG